MAIKSFNDFMAERNGQEEEMEEMLDEGMLANIGNDIMQLIGAAKTLKTAKAGDFAITKGSNRIYKVKGIAPDSRVRLASVTFSAPRGSSGRNLNYTVSENEILVDPRQGILAYRIVSEKDLMSAIKSIDRETGTKKREPVPGNYLVFKPKSDPKTWIFYTVTDNKMFRKLENKDGKAEPVLASLENSISAIQSEEKISVNPEILTGYEFDKEWAKTYGPTGVRYK